MNGLGQDLIKHFANNGWEVAFKLFVEKSLKIFIKSLLPSRSFPPRSFASLGYLSMNSLLY